jgi:hypothetical protein
MAIFRFLRVTLRLAPRHTLIPLFAAALLLAASALNLRAASIHGVVTDATGARVTGASVALISNGQVVASAASVADGTFTITTGASGRFVEIV